MLTRRAFLVTSAVAAALLAAGPGAWAQSGDQATSFVVTLGNQMVAVVDGPGSIEQKKKQMQPLLEQAVDLDQIARFCLGQFWSKATPEQQQRFVQLFHQAVINELGGKLGEFRGVTFTTTTTTERNGDFYVGTVIRRPNQQPNNVQWVVSFASGRPKIIDVYAEGTSLRLTKRDDYRAFLTRNGSDVNALIAAMQRQLGA